MSSLLKKYWYELMLLVLVMLLWGLSFYYYKSVDSQSSAISITPEKTSVVEIAGAVKHPGVYTLSSTATVFDLIKTSGGFSNSVDMLWVAQSLNMAEDLEPSTKLYIPYVWDNHTLHSGVNTSKHASKESNGLINVNTATKSELIELNGVGDSYSQNIIDSRPYADLSDFKSRSGLSESLVNKIESQIEF